MRVTALDVRNSGDTQGGRDRVVGYGAFAMEFAAAARHSDVDRARLLDAARASLSFGAENGRAMRAGLGSGLSPSLTAMRAVFVTIGIGGKLRGCHGSVIAQKPLLLDVVANAYKAAFEDRRFGPLTVEELAAAGPWNLCAVDPASYSLCRRGRSPAPTQAGRRRADPAERGPERLVPAKCLGPRPETWTILKAVEAEGGSGSRSLVGESAPFPLHR